MLSVFVNSIVLFSVAYFCYTKTSTFKKLYWPLLCLKIICGVGVGLLYTFYYSSGDTFTIFEDASLLANQAHEDVQFYFNFLWNSDDTFKVWDVLSSHDLRYLFFVKIVSIINIVTTNNYWLTASCLSLLSFLCTWRLVQILVKIIPEQKIPTIFALFFPSVVLWSSGILKETLALSCLFTIADFFIRIWFKKKLMIMDGIFLFISTWILWRLKYYYAAVFLPLLFSTWLVHFVIDVFKIEKLVLKFGLVLLVLILSMIGIYFSHPNFYNLRLPALIVENYQLYYQQSKTESVIQFAYLNPSILSFLLNSPWALFSILFRPMFWEASNILQMMASIENLFLLVLTAAAFMNWRNVLRSNYRSLIFLILIYTIVLSVFLALSAPNFGTLSRYRLGFLPFYVLVISCSNPLLISIYNFIERTFYRLVR